MRSLDVFAVVGVHLQDAADALLFAFDRVEDHIAGIQHAGIDAEEHQLAEERVGHDFEAERGERFTVIGLAHQRGGVVVGGRVRARAANRRHLDRARQVVNHAVQHRLHALVLERRAAEHRDDFVGERADADAFADVLGRQVAAVEIGFHQLLVGFGRGLDQFFAVRITRRRMRFRDVALLELRAHRVLVPIQRLHLHQVDDAFEVLLGADGQLHDHRLRAEPGLNLPDHAQKVGAGAVHFVDERHARHAVFVGLPPHRLRLRLDAADRAEHRHRAVQHAQRALHLDGEVNMAGGVDDVDAVLRVLARHAGPEAGGGGGGDGDAALLFLLHPVHDRVAVVHFAHLVRQAGVEEDALGGRGLAGVDVRHDADVAVAFERSLAGHYSAPMMRSVNSLPVKRSWSPAKS